MHIRRPPSGDGPRIYRPNESVAVRLEPPARPVAHEPDSIPPSPRDSLLAKVNRRRGTILTVVVSIAAIASFGSVVWWAHNQDVKAGGRGLEPLVVQPFHLREAPLAFLAIDALVAKEGVAGLCRREEAKDACIRPVRMLFLECHPDADSAVRVDFKLSVALDVAELTWRSIVENEDNRGQPFRQVYLPVQNLRNRHRPVAPRVDVFKVLTEMISVAGIRGVLVNDQVILGNGYPPELVGSSGCVGGAYSRSGTRSGIAGGCRCIRNGGFSGNRFGGIGSRASFALARAGEHRSANECYGGNLGKH